MPLRSTSAARSPRVNCSGLRTPGCRRRMRMPDRVVHGRGRRWVASAMVASASGWFGNVVGDHAVQLPGAGIRPRPECVGGLGRRAAVLGDPRPAVADRAPRSGSSAAMPVGSGCRPRSRRSAWSGWPHWSRWPCAIPSGSPTAVRGLLDRLVPRVLRRRPDPGAIADGVGRRAANVRELATDPTVLRRAALLTLANWILDVAVVAVLALTVGAGTPVAAILLAYVVAQVAAVQPAPCRWPAQPASRPPRRRPGCDRHMTRSGGETSARPLAPAGHAGDAASVGA